MNFLRKDVWQYVPATTACLLLSFLSLFCNQNSLKKQSQAINGTIDLSDWNFKKDGIANLDGEWEFYWQKLLTPEDFQEKTLPQKTGNIKIPNVWNGYKIAGEKLKGDGYATYRLKIKIKQGEELSLNVLTFATAYNLFVDEKLILKAGEVSKSSETAIPSFQPELLKIPNRDSSEIQIIIQISNYHHQKGGLWDKILIGHPKHIRQFRERNLFLNFFLFGSLLIMGFYHLGLYSIRKKEKSALYFGLFCFLISIRTLVTDQCYFFTIFPSTVWELGLKLEYLTITLGAPVFLLFLANIFPDETHTTLNKLIQYPSYIISLFVALFPTRIFSHALVYMQMIILFLSAYSLYVMLKASFRKKEGALSFLFGSFAFILFIVNDVLHSNQVVSTGYYASLGFFIFIVSQSFVLSMRFTTAFNRVEDLSATLEQKVIERTTELEESKHETEALNQITIKLTESPSLNDTLYYIFDYVMDTYRLDVLTLYFIDKESSKVIPFKVRGRKIPDDKYNYIKNTTFDILKDSSLIYYAIQKSKSSYIPKVKKNFIKSIPDKEFVDKLGVLSVFYMPIRVGEECIGIFVGHTIQDFLKLSKENLKSISRFASQIAGVLQKEKILQETMFAKHLAEVAQIEAEKQREKSDKLLLNILPQEVANELKEYGEVKPVFFDNVSIIFTDFKGFTQIAENLSPQELVKELDICFSQFDKIVEYYKLEKLKTIGDSYMCAGGLPVPNKTHAIDCCLAALEIQNIMNQTKKIKEKMDMPYWELRLGINSGPVMAGVVGEKKFAYDIWGDTVNTASRMESSGTPGRINISYSTYYLVKDFFECDYRGEVNAKHKGKIKMFYLNRIKKDLSSDMEGRIPNEKFFRIVSLLFD